MKSKWNVLFLLIAVVMIMASCSNREVQEETVKEETQDAAVKVTALTAGPQMMADIYKAVGTVKSGSRSMLSPKVMGHVINVTVDQGDAVKKGQLLVEIDSRDIAAQLQQSKSGLEEARQALSEVEDGISAAESGVQSALANKDLAEKTYERYSKLKEQKSVSQQEFDQVESQKKMAGAEADRAANMLESMKAKKKQVESKIEQAKQVVKQVEVMQGFAKIHAPFDGIVVSRTAEPGQLAAPGAPLLVIEDDTDYRLEAQVEETYMSSVSVGDKVNVEFDAVKNKIFEGIIKDIVPTVDPKTRTFIVEIQLPDEAGVLSGMFGRAIFKKGESSVCRIPKSALVQRGQLEGVYVAVDEKAAFRLVKVGRKLEDDTVEIITGLTPGDVLIINNTDQLSDGRAVEIEKVLEVEK